MIEKRKYTFDEPQSNVINVSSKKNPKSYKLVAKVILKKFGDLKLRSLGNAAEFVVILAEALVRNGFAEYHRIDSDMADL